MRRFINSPMTYVAGVALLFLFVAWLTLFLWRTFVPQYDLEWDTRNALALLHHGVIPKHSGVASFFVLNPPGVTFGLLPGLLLCPTEPALAERISSLLLLALTLAGMYQLLAKRFGHSAAFLSATLYMLSTIGLYFADSLRPRAHPVFLIWMLFFLDRWVNENSRRALAYAVFIYIAANFWMMEILPAGLLFLIVWFVYRPPLPKLGLAVALATGLLLWSPYLAFESHRGFKDMRGLITRKSSISDYNAAFHDSLTNPELVAVENRRVHAITGGKLEEAKAEPDSKAHIEKPEFEWVTDDRVGWCYKATHEDLLEGQAGIWLCPAPTHDWWFVTRDGNRWFKVNAGWMEHGPEKQGRSKMSARFAWASKLKLLLPAPFPESNWHGGPLLLGFLVIFGLAWSGVGEVFARRGIRAPLRQTMDGKQRACLLMLGMAGSVPAIMIAGLVNLQEADFSRRFLWLWVALAPFIVVLLRSMFRPTIAYTLAGILIVLTACNPTMTWKTRALLANHFGAAPDTEMNQVIAYVAGQAKAEGRTSLPIGYDLPFIKWIVCAHATDGMSKVGDQYDLLFLMRHGITNTDTRAEGISPEDDFRIVEHDSGESWRQTYFDLSSYPRMEVALETSHYTVLRKPK